MGWALQLTCCVSSAASPPELTVATLRQRVVEAEEKAKTCPSKIMETLVAAAEAKLREVVAELNGFEKERNRRLSAVHSSDVIHQLSECSGLDAS